MYGINPFELTPSQIKLLQMGIPRVLAKREMLDRNARSSMDEDRLHRLVYDIYEDEDKANKAVANFVINKAKRNQS